MDWERLINIIGVITIGIAAFGALFGPGLIMGWFLWG